MEVEHPPGVLVVSAASDALVPVAAAAIREFNHEAVFALKRHSSEFVVVNSITGEKIALPTGHHWRLAFSGSRAYACSETHAPMWLAGMARDSLWVKGGRTFVHQKGGDGVLETSYWIDEVKHLYEATAVKLHPEIDGVLIEPIALKMYKMQLPRAGARIFIELTQLMTRLIPKAPHQRRNFRQSFTRVWLPAFVKEGMPAEHVLWGTIGLSNMEVKAGEFFLPRTAVSAECLLLLLMRCATRGADDASVRSSTAIMATLFEYIKGDVSLSVSFAESPLEGDPPCEVKVSGGMAQPCPAAVQHLGDAAWKHPWPRECVNLRALCFFLWHAHRRAFASLLAELAIKVEVSILAGAFGDAAALWALAAVAGTDVDPDVRLLCDALGRNAYSASRVARKLLGRFPLHRSKVDHACQLRYLMASRKNMAAFNTVATCVDATRFAKRDWSCGLACNVDNGICMWMPPVALRDSSVRGAKEGEVDKEEKSAWKAAALTFLKAAYQLDKEAEAIKAMPHKQQRLASFYLAHACDVQLQAIGVNGYRHFYAAADDARPVHERPLLLENMDSHSVNLCKTFFLLDRGARLLPFWDVFHKRWNMASNALKRCDLWQSVKLQSITFEVNRGPYKGFAFFIQQLEAAEALVRTVEANDELFMHFFERICRDRGEDVSKVDPQEVLAGLRESRWLHVQGPKTADTRWWSFMHAQKFFAPYNGERLCGLCYLGLQHGWFTKEGRAAAVLRPLRFKAKAAPAETKKVAMREASEAERQARDRCQNTLHLTATILAHAEVQFDVALVAWMTTPHQSLHSALSTNLRSMEVAQVLALDLALGASGTKIIEDTMALFQDSAELQKLGFDVQFIGAVWKGRAADHPAVQNQQLMMAKASKLAFELCAEEVYFGLMFRCTYPYRFAVLLCEDEALVNEELLRMRLLWAAWAEAKASKMQVWKAVVRRSSLNWTVVAETFSLAAALEWKMDAQLRTQVARMFRHPFSTVVVERAFQKLRDRERDNSSKELSATSVWRKPTVDRVLTEVHQFKEVDPLTVPRVAMEQEKLPASLFKPAFAKSSDDFKELPGRGPVPYSSPKACQLHFIGSETDMLELFFRRGAFHEAPGAWRSLLAHPSTLLRRKGMAETWFVMGISSGLLYLWAAEVRMVGKICVWGLVPSEGRQMLRAEVILDLSDWEAIPYVVRSPASMYMEAEKKSPTKLPMLPACQSGEPLALLKHAATHAFPNLSKTLLLRMDKEEFGIIEEESSLGDILVTLIMHVLGVEIEEAVAIAMLRCRRDDIDERTSILQSEEASEVLEQREWNTLCGDVKKLEGVEDFANELLEELRGIAEKYYPRPKKVGKKMAAAKRWVEGKTTVVEAAKLLPAGAKLWADQGAARYQVFYNGSSCSRAWVRYGHGAALRQVVQWVWTLHTRATGEACAVEGLFP